MAGEKIIKGDFVEIQFTGKANGEIFDSNIPEDLKKLNKEGKEITPIKYDEIYRYRNGFCIAKIDFGYGYINASGKEITHFYYEKPTDFNYDANHKLTAKVVLAGKEILIDDFSKLVQYKNKDAFTLTPEDFLKAYKFSVRDGYRIDTRGKKDNSIIEKLEIYIKK